MKKEIDDDGIIMDPKLMNMPEDPAAAAPPIAGGQAPAMGDAISEPKGARNLINSKVNYF